MNKEYIKLVAAKYGLDLSKKTDIECKAIELSTKLLVLESEVENAYKRSQMLANKQQELYGDVEALTDALRFLQKNIDPKIVSETIIEGPAH